MLFETAQKKPVAINGNSLRSTTQTYTTSAKPPSYYAGINQAPRKPAQRSAPVLNSTSLQQRPLVRNATYAPVRSRPAVPFVTQPKGYKSSSAKPFATGYYKTATRPPVTITQTYMAQPRRSYPSLPAKQVVPAGPQYNYLRNLKPTQLSSLRRTIPRRVYRRVMVPGRWQMFRGKRIYSPPTSTYQAYPAGGTALAPATNISASPANGNYVPGYGYCTPQPPVNNMPAANVPTQPLPPAAPSQQPSYPGAKKPCHTCGLKTKGCSTLSRFSFNSAQLKTSHKKAIRELAIRIINQHDNAVTATGHTDSSGTEDYNDDLGARRASAVIRELRKQLSLLKPNAHKNLFWKTLTRGEKQPISKTDAAANRRVHLCIRKIKAA